LKLESMFKFPIAIIGLQHHSYKQQNPHETTNISPRPTHDSTMYFCGGVFKALYGAWKCKAQQKKKFLDTSFLFCKVQQVLGFRALSSTLFFFFLTTLHCGCKVLYILLLKMLLVYTIHSFCSL
jgi:hypothetical protein